MTSKTKAVVRPRSAHLSLLFLLLAPPCSAQEQDGGVALHGSFVRCVARLSPATADPSRLVHAPSAASYPSLLNATIQNLRFASARTPRPALLLTPATVAEARACVACCRRQGLTVRARSGGHDYEGLSYRSVLRPGGDAGARPFAVVDVAALRDVRVDAARRVARVGPGATLGELYYAVARDSDGALGFPAGICPTPTCVGGHLSGSGFGPMMRKHGLGADNVVDAEVVDAEGRLLDRAVMGEGLFWAIRGGGGGSFGVVVSWTVRLVPVPRVVSAFTVRRLVHRGDRRQTQAAVRLLAKWQRVAHALPDDLFVKAAMEPELDGAGERHPLVTFKSLFLGNCSGMVAEMSAHLPELGVRASDCRDMSWIQSMLYFYGYTEAAEEVLLDRSLQPKDYYKVKLDYVTTPIPAAGLAGLLARVVEDRGGSIDVDPQGGAMGETPESATPYAHRRGYLYNVQYFVKWGGDANVSYEDAHLAWVRGVHRFMTPYASAKPRAAYVNFRDLDLGQNVEGETTYEAARAWGEMCFRGNFRRLAVVKAEVDPDQVFWSEQSIPPLLGVGEETGERHSPSGLLSDS